MMHLLEEANRFINGFIGLCILLILTLLFLHIMRWMVLGSRSSTGRASIGGALRAFIALFLIVDIWAIIRAFQLVTDISPAVAYLVVLLGALLLGAWSFLGIGSVLVDSLVKSVDWLVNRTILLLRSYKARNRSRAVRFLQSKNDATLRFFLLAIAIIAISIPCFYWAYIGGEPSAKITDVSELERAEEAVYAEPLVHDESDFEIDGTTYINHRYGIRVTYPEGWIVERATSSNTLMIASNSERTLYSQLNAGSYGDIPGSSRDAYLQALWRIEKYVHMNFAENSAGILQANTIALDDISSSSASLIKFVSYWPTEDGGYMPVFDNFYMFGHGPTYFTLHIKYWDEVSEEELESSRQAIMDSIRLTPAL